MRARVVAAAGALALSLLGGAATAAPSTALKVPVYFYRDGALTQVSMKATKSETAATTAIDALLAGPPRGYTTAIPAGVHRLGLAVSGNIATVTLSRSLGRPGRSAQGQIVSTLAKVLGKRVLVSVAGKGPVTLEHGDGRALTTGARIGDYIDLTAEAPIFVRAPARDSTVTGPVHASGTSDVFEATFQVEVESGGVAVANTTIMATSGTGTRGTSSQTLTLPKGDVTLVFYEASAKDGSRVHVTRVPLHVR